MLKSTISKDRYTGVIAQEIYLSTVTVGAIPDISFSQGVSWDSSNDTYIRLETLKAIATGISAGNSNLPIQSKMKRCLVIDDGTVNYYLDPNDSSKKADGSDSDLTGADGQVMVEIPRFYVKQELVGTVMSWYISLYNIEDFAVHPAFSKDGIEVGYRYYSAFEGSMYDDSESAMCVKEQIHNSYYAPGDKMCSVINQWCKTNEQRSEYRSMAAERGTGWRQLDYYLYSAVQLLYLIEYADFNSQSMIGMGRTELSGGSWVADSYIGKTGLSIADGNGTNSVSNGGSSYATDYMSYRGIENWYGNVWKMCDGITWDGRWTGSPAAQPVYVTNNSAYFKDEGDGNMSHICDASYIGANAGYIGNIENVIGFIPKTVGASSTTKLCDYYYQYSEAGRNYWRLVLVGGIAFYGVPAGGFSLYVSDAWSLDVASVGGRLCF